MRSAHVLALMKRFSPPPNIRSTFCLANGVSFDQATEAMALWPTAEKENDILLTQHKRIKLIILNMAAKQIITCP